MRIQRSKKQAAYQHNSLQIERRLSSYDTRGSCTVHRRSHFLRNWWSILAIRFRGHANRYPPSRKVDFDTGFWATLPTYNDSTQKFIQAQTLITVPQSVEQVHRRSSQFFTHFSPNTFPRFPESKAKGEPWSRVDDRSHIETPARGIKRFAWNLVNIFKAGNAKYKRS